MLYFPLPYSSKGPLNGPAELTTHSQLVLLALLATMTPGDTVILIGEQTYQDPAHLTAELMETFLLHNGIAKENIETIPTARNNTWQQLAELKKQIGNEPVTLIAFRFHAPRVQRTASRLGLRFSILLMEDILKNNSVVEKVRQANKKILLHEYVLRLLAYIDTRGVLQNSYTNHFGPRAPLV